MSILIKGITMPSGLAERGIIICGDGRVYNFIGTTIEGCYAVEVPTSHGRLIDADNLVSVIDDEFTEQTRTLSNPIEVLNKALLCGFAKDVITAAPTIIEAEERGKI